MNRKLLLICLVLSFACLSVTAWAQNPRPDPSETLKQLLAMPAPQPRTATPPDGDESKESRPADFFEKDKMPPDDAPIADLLEYWDRWAANRGGPDPSDSVRQRLLDACAADPESLPRFLPLLPQTEAAAAVVKGLYDKEQGSKDSDEGWLDQVKQWLLFHTKYFLNDLLALANKVKDDDKNGDIDKEEALSALADVDWATAEPLVQRFSNGGQQRTATYALSLLYKHAREASDLDAEGKYRSRLLKTASDRNAPGQARHAAIEVLSVTDWSGRDDWYLSLLADDTLRELHDGMYGFSPLDTLFRRDPDKWIPVMAKLVESKDRAVQQGAASCLVGYTNFGAPRRDAILPVLRWLSDPDWLQMNGTERAWFMQHMDDLDMPESVPGLIWIVENEESNRIWAARTLAHYKDPRAVPALKKALAAEKNESNRNFILEGLFASGGPSDDEQVAALEAYATKLTSPDGREEVERYRSYGDDPLPVPLSIGRYLVTMREVPESLARAVLARSALLQKSNPSIAQAMLEIAHHWQGRLVDLDMLQRIANGSADAKTIAKALERRSSLQESVGTEVRALVGAEGSAVGIAAVLLDEKSLGQSILMSGSEPAQVALLACARLAQMPLVVESVGALMQSKNPLVAQAAEAYLLAEDSKEAQNLVWARHPNEAFVTGWQGSLFLSSNSAADGISSMEEKLRSELRKENGPIQIFSLVGTYGHYGRFIREYRDRVVFTQYDDAVRYRERVITSVELTAFKAFIAANNLETLGPQFRPCHHDCWEAEFLSLTKDKGRRLIGHQGFGDWMPLFEQFDLLGHGAGAKVHYNLEQEIKGLEVLYADESLVVKDVWQQGADVRIFVGRVETEEEIDRRHKADNSVDEDEDDAARAERRLQERIRQQARSSWRPLVNHKAGDPTRHPPGFSTFDEGKFPLSEDESDSDQNERQVQPISPDSIVFARNFEGLWRQAAGQKAVRISGEKGAYVKPVVTPDGKWVIAAKTDRGWADPNYIVRFNLQTAREYKIELAPADELQPVAYLATHGKVLLRRAKSDYQASRNKAVGPEAPEFYLLDTTTGQALLTSGVFAPLLQEGQRFLQPTSKPDEFWAAIPDRDRNQTQVGRYNLKNFSFQSVLTVPHISFESMSMWVDESGDKIYLVYQGHLLRLPLRKAQ